jgi:glutamyl-tRNA synthetase
VPSLLAGPNVPWTPSQFDEGVFRTIAPLAQTRLVVLPEIVALVDFLFLDAAPIDEAAFTKTFASAEANAVLADCIDTYATLASWDHETLKTALEEIGTRHGLKLGKAQAPVRVAVTGRTVGPPLFEALEILGRERTLERLNAARTRTQS